MTDRAAVRALVLGLLALPFGVFAPFAILSGVRSLSRIRASGGRLRGGACAVGGVAGGILGLLAIVVGIAFWLATS